MLFLFYLSFLLGWIFYPLSFRSLFFLLLLSFLPLAVVLPETVVLSGGTVLGVLFRRLLHRREDILFPSWPLTDPS